MRRFAIAGWLAIVSAGLVACGDDVTLKEPGKGAGGEVPLLEIAASATSGVAPVSVSFTAAVTGGDGEVAVAWDFGDGSNATGQQASHEFTAAGTYVVRATATDSDGDVGSDLTTVIVTADLEPEVWAEADRVEGAAPLRVAFRAVAGSGNGALRYSWEFGDGASSTLSNPIHLYEAAGSFTATVTVTDEDGDTASAEVAITAGAAGSTGAPHIVARVVSGACGIPQRTVADLDGSATTDPDGDPLTFEWVVTRSPPLSEHDGLFSNPHGPRTYFRPDAPGAYELRLFVRDLEGLYASAPLQVVADDTAASIAIVSGNHQTARTGEVFADALKVNVKNSCGLSLPEEPVYWRGTNATLGDFSSITNELGGAWNTAYAGGKVGQSEVEVFARTNPEVKATFALEVEVGLPALLLMDSADDVEISETQGAPLTFRLTDRFGNEVTGHEAEFVLSTSTSPVNASFDAFESGTVEKTVTTTGGVATVPLFSGGGAGMARVRMVSGTCTTTGAALRMGGWHHVGGFDFEQGGDAVFRVGDWEVGTPTSGPRAAHGGTKALATKLAGNFDHMVLPLTPHHASMSVQTENGGIGQYYRLRFAHWFDLGPLQDLPDFEYETPRASGPEFRPTQCSPAIGEVSLNHASSLVATSPFGAALDSGAMLGPCWEPYDFGYGNTFAGASSGWKDAELWTNSTTSNTSLQLAFELFSDATHALPTGPGWYVDDVEIDAFAWDNGIVKFLPSATPATINLSVSRVANIDATCASPGMVELSVRDAYGNLIAREGITLELSVTAGSTISGVMAGSNPTGLGTEQASVQTDERGVVRVLLSSSAASPVVLTASLQGVAGSEDSVSYLPDIMAAPSENAFAYGCVDGIDNDCDGVSDCEDPNCMELSACQGISCENPVEYSTTPIGADGYFGSLCGRGQNGLGTDAPAGYNDLVMANLYGCNQTMAFCLNGPTGVQVEIGSIYGEDSCGFFQEFEFGPGCHFFSVNDCSTDSYFVLRAPEAECGSVSFIYGAFDD